MSVAGAVDADAHEPAFVVEELAPLGREQQAVRLNAVADALPSPVVLLQPHGLLVERKRSEHGFAAVPGKKHVGCLLQLNVVAHEAFEKLVGHDRPAVRRHVLFLQIIAILTPQIARGSCRLGHHI